MWWDTQIAARSLLDSHVGLYRLRCRPVPLLISRSKRCMTQIFKHRLELKEGNFAIHSLLHRLGAYPPGEDMPQYHASVILLVPAQALPLLPWLPWHQLLPLLQALQALPSPAQALQALPWHRLLQWLQAPPFPAQALQWLPLLRLLPWLPSPALEVLVIGCSQSK